LIGLIFLIGLEGSVFGQGIDKIDSISNTLNSLTKVERFEALRDLYSLYNQFDYTKSYDVSLDALRTAEELKDSLLIIRAYRMNGLALGHLTKNPEAISVFLKALKMAEASSGNAKIKEQIKYILNSIATTYTDAGNYAKALEYNFRSLVIRQEEGNKADESIALNNIGLVYYRMDDYQSAIDFYSKCLDIKRQLNPNGDSDQHFILINLALCHIALNDFQKAISNVQEALEQCGNGCNKEIEREAFNSLGIAYFQTGKTERAEKSFLKSLEIARVQNNIPSVASNLIYLGRIERQKGSIENASILLKDAETILLNTDYPKAKLELYSTFYELYQDEKNFELASDYQGKFIQLNREIFSRDLIKNLREVQTNYAERENIKTIKEQDEILELRQQLINRQRTQFASIVAVTLLSLSMVLLLLVTNRKQKQASAIIAMARNKIEEQNKQLEDQNKELDKKVKERTKELSESNRQLTDVNSELDNFLYKSSHDLSGPLASLQGLVNLAYMEPKDEFHQLRLLGDLTSQIEKMSKMLSRLSLVSEVNHASLESQKIDLEKALSALFEFEKKTYQSSNVQLSFTIQSDVELVSDKLLFETIVENLVTNGIKFYNSNNRAQRFVHVEISKAGSMVCIRVSDNGLGIASIPDQDVFRMFMRGSERSETGGVGLYLTKICVNRLGGNIQLEQTSGDGSTFLVQLPCDLTPILEERKQFQEAVKRKEREALEGAGKLTSTK